MALSIALFTIGGTAVAAQQFRYWRNYGRGSERWVSLGWMIAAWLLGALFIAGMKFPVPVKPLFPNWK